MFFNISHARISVLANVSGKPDIKTKQASMSVNIFLFWTLLFR